MPVAKFLLIVGSAGALTAWLVAAGSPRPAQSAAADRAETNAGAAAPAADLAVETARLRTAIAAMPARLQARRDLFRYEGRRQPSGDVAFAEDSAASAAGVLSPVETPTASTRPEIKLLGIAEDATPGGVVRTAILSTPQQLHLVREGEQVALRFLVQRITTSTVELRDLADDTLVSLQWR